MGVNVEWRGSRDVFGECVLFVSFITKEEVIDGFACSEE